MIAEIRIRYAVHALLLGLAMVSAVFPFWFPWFYVVKHREGITYTSLWKIESIRTVEMSREQVISTTTETWREAGFPSVGRTFHLCFLLTLAGISITFVQFVCINLMSFFVRRCLYNLRVWSFTLRNVYLFLSFTTFALFFTATCYFLRIMRDLLADQADGYHGFPCLSFSPCFQFIGTNTTNSAYQEWGPIVGWCSLLAASLFSFLTILSSLLLQGRLKIRRRKM